jgi:hypothetical protein
MNKFLVKFLLIGTIGGLIIPGIASLVVANTSHISMFSKEKYCQESTQGKYSEAVTQEFKNCANEIIVKVLKDPIWGSGVLIKEKTVGIKTIYTIITNAHVLEQVKAPYRIQTSDGETYKANLLGKFDRPDVALLEFTTTKKYSVASLYAAFSFASLPKEEVFAAGYPIDNSKGFVVRKGKISVLLPQAMFDGYQIGSSADIEQGMSGGALLNREGQLVGIIGKTSSNGFDFSDVYKFDNNFTPTSFLKPLMEDSSWAIPIEVALNKWGSEFSSNLAWNLPPSSTPIVSSNIAKHLSSSNSESRNQLLSPDAVIITQQKTPQKNFEPDTKNNLQLKVERSQENYRLVIRNPEKKFEQVLSTAIKLSEMKYINHQPIDLDKLQEEEMIVNFSPNNSCPEDMNSFFYSYNSKNHKYSLIKELELRANYSMRNLDQDQNLEIKSLDRRFACKFTSKYTNDMQKEFLPLQIWKYKNNSVSEVTRSPEYRQIHIDHAKKMLNYYHKHRDYFNNNNNTDELQALLSAYLASKYLANEEEEGWKNLYSIYTFNGQYQYTEKLERLLKINYSSIEDNK